MKQLSPQFFHIISFIAAFLIIFVELNDTLPSFIVVFLPIVGALAIFIFYWLLNSFEKARTFIFSLKGIFSVLCLFLILLSCCTPVNEFTTYLSLSRYPFRQYYWLVTSLIGVLFALSIFNYTLLCPNRLWVKIIQAGRCFWRLPVALFLLINAVWVFIIANLFSYAIFAHIPHVQDEIAQFMQAKIFARGCLTAPVPPLPEFFQYFYDNMIISDRWYSQYPPGHSFFLMFGVLFRIPWIINPLFASGSVVLLYLCATRYYGEKEGRYFTIYFVHVIKFYESCIHSFFSSFVSLLHTTRLRGAKLFLWLHGRMRHRSCA